MPTRARLRYLEVALASIAPQARAAGAELVVVEDDRGSAVAHALCERLGVRYLAHGRPLGLNHARNTGVAGSTGELVVFVDDDVEVRAGWLAALLAAARAHPDVDVFTGPVRAQLEGSPPRGCGRERAPITTLDLGERDAFTEFAWGANMAIRRAALERVGPFEEALHNGGDEQEWQERLWRERSRRESEDGRGNESGRDESSRDESVAGQGGERRSVESRGDGGTDARTLYVAAAALDHRRDAADSRLLALCRATYARGRGARRFDTWRGRQPPLRQELRTLLACVGHVLRRRCPAGATMVAHSAGRLACAIEQTRMGLFARTPPSEKGTPPIARPTPPLAEPTPPLVELALHLAEPTPPLVELTPPLSTPPLSEPTDDFLSGESGTVGGLGHLRRAAIDARTEALQLAAARPLRLGLAARRFPPARRVLALCVERPHNADLASALAAELGRSRHRLELRREPPGAAGKFESLNRVLKGARVEEFDWLFVLDDDIALPRGFIDRFLFLAERFSLDLAQPAHRARSHAAWQVTRRRPGAVVRETGFVEIGPVTAFARRTFPALLPFPPLRMGWGLDLHWGALAAEHGWRCGVIDAVAIAHRRAPAASAYSREQAIGEARAFLRERPYLPAVEAQRTIATHARW